MIPCPEGGQEAPDDAKFCDRCGRGLSKAASPATQSSPTRPTPLTAGASLKNGIEIVALTSQTSIENRYSAKRVRDGKTESIALRERLGPNPREDAVGEATRAWAPKPAQATLVEDPNGPRPKTAELNPPTAQTNGTASAAPSQSRAASAPATASSTQASGGEGIQSAVAAEVSTPAIEEAAEEASPDEASEAGEAAVVAETGQAPSSEDGSDKDAPPMAGEDLGEGFGRVLALSQTISHPAFQRATEGFAENGRVYLVYADEELKPLRRGPQKMSEPEAVAAAVQICQAISFVHRRALRLNDICPESIAVAKTHNINM